MTRLDMRQLVATEWCQENADTHVNEINSAFSDSRHHRQAHGSIPEVCILMEELTTGVQHLSKLNMPHTSEVDTCRQPQRRLNY